MTERCRINKTKSSLLRGETVLIAEVNRMFNPVVTEVIAQAGFTSVWYDMEHSHLDVDTLSTMILAARTVDVEVFVRIPHGPYNTVIKPLEMGAAGLIWPHCRSVDEAKEFVRMAKFRPLGLRGVGGGRDSGYGTVELAEYLDRANAETLLGVMIEDAEGVEEVDEIAALDGIDLLFVGHGDLAHSYGVERDGGHAIMQPRVLEAFDRVGAACRRHGKVMGTAAGPGEQMTQVVERGARWLNCCHDTEAVRNGYSQARNEAEALVG